MKSPVLILLSAVASLSLSACAFFRSGNPDETKEKPSSKAPQLVGRIASVPADKRFVLIQSYGSWNVETGTILTTRGPDERTANLLVTGESLGNYAAADLQSGFVDVGDAVYSHHSPQPVIPTSSSPPATELPENQQNPDSENVQKNN